MTWPERLLPRFTSPSVLSSLKSPADLQESTEKLSQHWEHEQRKPFPNLTNCLWRVFGHLYVKYFSLFLLVAVGQLCVAGSLSLLTLALKEEDWERTKVFTGVYCLCSFATICSLNQGYYRGQVLGAIVRHSLTQLLLEKFGKLTKSVACSPHNKGLLLTLISSELDLLDSLSCTPFLIITPVYILLSLPVLWLLLGPAGIIGVVSVLLIYPLKAYLLKYVAKYRSSTLQLKELRTRSVQKLVEGIKTVKMYLWEEHFVTEIEKLKELEHQQYKKTNAMQTISATFLISGGSLVLLVTVTAQICLGQQLETARIFGALSVLLVMNNLVHGITNAGIDVAIYTRQALAKVSELLLLPEHHDVRVQGPMGCSHLSAAWQPGKTVLSDVTFNLHAGELCIIAGSVGSGKSSLLSVLAGELPLLSGTCSLSHSLAYVEQEPWVALSSIRDNIIMGETADEERYREVLQVCALGADLEKMPAGDKTFVGEKGGMLSGGQRARLSLARAAYRRRDVYLLDDPLSALDSKVGFHVFQSCVLGLLKGSTRLLVTNNPCYFPYADKILLLDSGSVASFCPSREFKATVAPTQNESDPAEPTTSPRTDIEEPAVTLSVYIHYLLLYFKNYWALGGLLGLAVVVQVAYLSPSYWVSYWATREDQEGLWYLVVLAGLVVVLFVLAAIRNSLMYSGLCKSNLRLHSDSLRGVCRASLSFFDSTSSGHVVARFTKDMAVLEEQLVYSFSDFALVAAVLGSYLIALVGMSPGMVPFLLAVLWGIYRESRALLPQARLLKRLELSAKATLVAQASCYLDGLAATRSLRLLATQQSLLHACISSSFTTQFCSFTILRVLQVRVDCLCILFTSVNAIAAGLIRTVATTDMLAVGFSFTVVLISYLGWFTDICACLGNYIISAHRLMQYAALPGEEQLPPSVQLTVTQGEIAFRNVSLRYSESQPLALKGVNFVVPGKTRLGIVGRTGAGKSSLLLVLMRLKEASSGAVLIDQQDVAKVALRDLRSKITVIPQAPLLFHGSLLANADPTSEFASFHVELTLKSLGLPADQDAAHLSCGQKQLLCLARALLRNTKIFVCDEATANVDPQTEAILSGTLREALSGKTVLLVAHRLRTVLDCEQVLVMEAGECVEIGRPETLRRDPSSRLAQLLRAANEETQ